MNNKLSRAIKWLYRNGRPLDVARYEYLFLNKSNELVISTLLSYQNEDGGFGHGLEPDSQNPFSTPIQTWMAFEIIEELDLDNDHPLIRNTINYLINHAPMQEGLYLATVPTNNSYPHAPWWTYSPEGCVWGYNPTIAIAGFIYRHANGENEKEFAAEIITKAIKVFLEKPSDNMHEIRAFLEMINFVGDLSGFKGYQDFLDKIVEQIDYTLEKNSALWFKTYCVRPLQYFDKASGFAYEQFADLAKQEANMIIDSLNKEGIWDTTWQWENYKEAEAIAMRDWKSSLIIGYLKMLRAYEII